MNETNEHAKYETTGLPVERWPEGHSDEDRSYIRTWAQVPGVKSSLEKANNEDHAQVGALLAKCIGFEMGRDHEGWWAWARLPGLANLTMGEGPTQLAAVEAAEKGG